MKLGVAVGHRWYHFLASIRKTNRPGKKCPQWWCVHKGEESTLTRVGGEIDYAEQNVLNSEKVGVLGGEITPPSPLADNPAVHVL